MAKQPHSDTRVTASPDSTSSVRTTPTESSAPDVVMATDLASLPATGVEPAQVVDVASTQWQDTFDVVVVGAGAAGVSAALQAREAGCRVGLVDRFEGGGTTARSGSVMYAGGGTALQQRLGVQDDPEAMFRYLRNEVNGIVTDDTLQQFCAQSAANISWVMKHGVRFSGNLFANKTSYPVHGYSLYYSGNEMAYAQDAAPAPRGHLADGIKRFTAFGPAFIGPLLRSAWQLGVEPLIQTRVKRLLVDAEGQVVGIEADRLIPNSKAARQHRWLSRFAAYAQIYYAPAAKSLQQRIERLERNAVETVRYRAHGGVVLATGGYILNRELTAHYLPKYKRAMRLGTLGDMGAGLGLGVSAGGVADKLGNATAWRFINPPAEWPKAALVNLHGQRYINETLYGATIGTRMMEENRGEAILIMDEALFKRSVANMNLKTARLVTLIQAKTAIRAAKRADTLKELAQRCHIDPEQLEATVRQYNAAASGDIPDPLGKQRDDMVPIQQGPFYAINMSVGKGDITSVISLGGLRVCEQSGAVLNQSSQPIAGIYAAGRTALGVASNAYVSGLSIADGVFSGRRAGQHAAEAAHRQATGASRGQAEQVGE